MLNLEECFRKGYIQRSPYAETLVKESMEKADNLLAQAKSNFENSSFDSALVMSYSAAFNAARAVLFRDGYREKSHECVIRYLEAKHPEIPSELIALLDRYRTSRHGVLYDVRYSATKIEAEEALEFAEGFIREIEKIIE
ncbi:MAG: HEPN domain-containing protein [Candidatus Diapherotrites archaeon]|nr:HEPN domain-containing protein [Candidatus Diapherotrites archaeon]